MSTEHNGINWQIDEESLRVSAAIAAALKPGPEKKLSCRNKLSKIGLDTVIDANGQGSYSFPDPEATDRFVRSLMARFSKARTASP